MVNFFEALFPKYFIQCLGLLNELLSSNFLVLMLFYFMGDKMKYAYIRLLVSESALNF